jgi:hypothetical protein
MQATPVPFIPASDKPKTRKVSDPIPKSPHLIPRTCVSKPGLLRAESDDDELYRQAHRLRRDLIETPNSKKAFNVFLADMKRHENDSLQDTVKRVLTQVFDMP